MSGMQFNIRLANLKMDALFCAVWRVALPSLTPAGGPVTYCCKPCFSKLEKAERSFEAAKRMINELRSTFYESTDDEKQTSESRIRTPAPLESEQNYTTKSSEKKQNRRWPSTGTPGQKEILQSKALGFFNSNCTFSHVQVSS